MTDPLNIKSPWPSYQWPTGKQSATLLSVDVDAQVPFMWAHRDGLPDRLATLEIRNFGPRTGLYRLIDLFKRYNVKASFYVPGLTAETNPEILPALIEAGHEVGLHGYFHEIVGDVSDAEFSGALEASIDLFIKQTGVKPVGFRSPAWEITPHMLHEIKRVGLAYDSHSLALIIPTKSIASQKFRFNGPRMMPFSSSLKVGGVTSGLSNPGRRFCRTGFLNGACCTALAACSH
ncbi:polysaccharide deacetylase family protein [Brucella rhizosphaerae]|uniref:polysaccharide deacetylase family protein n=1 Tax=Brucella rhizosphaerae TaxID=571254 RepID=UPI0036186D7D